MSIQPPKRITLLWCPVCGRDDLHRDLKPGAGRHNVQSFGRTGRCAGTPVEIEYTPTTPVELDGRLP